VNSFNPTPYELIKINVTSLDSFSDPKNGINKLYPENPIIVSAELD
jgi:hypothetical protein